MRLDIKAVRTLPEILLLSCIGMVLGFGLIFTSPVLVMIALAGCFFTLVAVKRNEMLILAFLVFSSTIVKEYNPPLKIGIGTIYLTDILLFISFCLIFLRRLTEPGFEIIRTPLDFPLIMFLVVAVVSTFVAILQSTTTFKESLGPIRAVGNYLSFFAVTNLIRDKGQLRRLWMGIILLALLTAVVMVIQYKLGVSMQIIPGRVEVLNTEGANFSGITRIIPPGESLIFVVFVIIAVSMVFEKINAISILKFLELGLLGFGIMLTYKRHFILAIGLLFIMLFYLLRPQARVRIIGVGIASGMCVVIFLLFIASYQSSHGTRFVEATIDRLETLTSGRTYQDQNSSLRWRDFEYRYAFPQIVSHPVIGLGLSTVYRPFVIGRDYLPGGDLRTFIHNGHLAMIVKSGLVGYFFFVWLSGVFLFRGFKHWRYLPDVKSQALVLGLSLGYVGIMIGSIVSPDILNYNWTAVLGIMFGTNECLYRYSSA